MKQISETQKIMKDVASVLAHADASKPVGAPVGTKRQMKLLDENIYPGFDVIVNTYIDEEHSHCRRMNVSLLMAHVKQYYEEHNSTILARFAKIRADSGLPTLGDDALKEKLREMDHSERVEHRLQEVPLLAFEVDEDKAKLKGEKRRANEHLFYRTLSALHRHYAKESGKSDKGMNEEVRQRHEKAMYRFF